MKVDRAKLGDIVFKNPEKRRMLDKLSHPRIFRKIIKELFKLKVIKKQPMVVLDAPLLFETRILEYFCYPNIVVYCDNTSEQLKRLMSRNSLTEEEAMRKISAQMPIGVKLRKADIPVDNSRSLKDLEKIVS